MRILANLTDPPGDFARLYGDRSVLGLALEKFREKCVLIIPSGESVEWLFSRVQNTSSTRIILEEYMSQIRLSNKPANSLQSVITIRSSDFENLPAFLTSKEFKELQNDLLKTPERGWLREKGFRKLFQGLAETSKTVTIIDQHAGKNLSMAFSGATWVIKQLLALGCQHIVILSTLQDEKTFTQAQGLRALETRLIQTLLESKVRTPLVEFFFCDPKKLRADSHPRQLTFEYENGTHVNIALDKGTENFTKDPLAGTPQVTENLSSSANRFRSDVESSAVAIWAIRSLSGGTWQIEKRGESEYC